MNLLEMTSPAVAKLSSDTPVVLPIAALEQHGGHMPLFTDSLLLGEVIRRVAEAVGDRVLFAPLMWLGNSEHHLDFAGTLTASPRTYLNLINELVENLLTHGFRRLVLINGHGGNIVPSQQALFEARQRHRQRGDLLLLSCTYWSLGAVAAEAAPGLAWVQQQMGHAGEWETSMILRIRPELVGAYQDLAPIPFGEAFPGAHRAWITKERSAPGHIGAPHAASAEKGEALLSMFSADVIRLLQGVADWDGGDWQ